MDDPIPMPGSFLFDLDQPVRPTLTKARPSLYIPPQSPSAASSLSKSFLSSHIPNSSNGSRKRARYDLSDSTSTDLQQIPQDDGNTDQSWAASTASYDSLRSPAPLVSTNYRLAGGWDTPTAAAASIYADGNDSAVADYRPSRFALQTQAVADDYVPSTPDVLSRERNGHKRALSSPQYQGWGKAVYNIVGGVAGKVFNFCVTSAFRGFYAGGGKGYAVDISAPTVAEKSTCMDVKEKEDVFNENYQRQHYREGTPIPGEFPVEGFIEDYMTQVQFYQGQDRSTPCRTAGEKASSGLKSRDTWVIVKNIETDSRESSPTRKIPKTSTFSQNRPISRGATAVRPRLAPSRPSRSSFAGSPSLAAGQPASFASPRRQIEKSNAVHRPQTPEGRHRRSQSSIASPRRSENVRHNHATPASPDVQKFEKKLRQKERAQQDSIERLAQQTKDMIREAREALGTRINIEDEAGMEDEGYGEGTELMSESKW
jgi:hypothetical protein